MRYRATINGKEVEAVPLYSEHSRNEFIAAVMIDRKHSWKQAFQPYHPTGQVAVRYAAEFLEALGFTRVED